VTYWCGLVLVSILQKTAVSLVNLRPNLLFSYITKHPNAVLSDEGCYVESSNEKKYLETGIKLSQTHLHEGQYEEAMSLCEKLMDLSSVSDEDVHLLSLSRVIASATAVASPHLCTDHRRLLVRLFLSQYRYSC